MLALVCNALGVGLFELLELFCGICRLGYSVKNGKGGMTAVKSTDSAHEAIVQLLVLIISVLLALYGFVVGSTRSMGGYFPAVCTVLVMIVFAYFLLH